MVTGTVKPLVSRETYNTATSPSTVTANRALMTTGCQTELQKTTIGHHAQTDLNTSTTFFLQFSNSAASLPLK